MSHDLKNPLNAPPPEPDPEKPKTKSIHKMQHTLQKIKPRAYIKYKWGLLEPPLTGVLTTQQNIVLEKNTKRAYVKYKSPDLHKLSNFFLFHCEIEPSQKTSIHKMQKNTKTNTKSIHKTQTGVSRKPSACFLEHTENRTPRSQNNTPMFFCSAHNPTSGFAIFCLEDCKKSRVGILNTLAILNRAVGLAVNCPQ